jgi:GntR family transcriptional regulator, transcriptional repressor for pyruvate dehydrogenase complex
MTAPPPSLDRLAGARSLTDRVAEKLARLVERGEVTPGSRLPTEMDMAARFGVSRTVVREAVARLKYAGVLASRQGSGVYVRQAGARPHFRIDSDPGDASVASVLEIVELRRGIEAEAAALAAERCTRRDLAAIRRAHAALRREEAAGRDGVEQDMELHRAIARASGNRHFPELWDFIGQFLRGAMRATRANESANPGFAADVRAEHQALVDAVARRDPAAARAAAIRHMDRAAARIRAAGPAFWRGEAALYTRSLQGALLERTAPRDDGGSGRRRGRKRRTRPRAARRAAR